MKKETGISGYVDWRIFKIIMKKRKMEKYLTKIIGNHLGSDHWLAEYGARFTERQYGRDS